MKPTNIKVSLSDNVADNNVAGQKCCPILLTQQGNNDRSADDTGISVESNGWTWNGDDEEDLGLALLFSNSAAKENHLDTNCSTILPSLSTEIPLAILQEEEKNIPVVTSDKNGGQVRRFEEMFSGNSRAFQDGEQHLAETKNSISGGYRKSHNEFDYEFRRDIIQHFLKMVEQEERLAQS